MAQSLYSDLRGKRVLVAGAGITGLACAEALHRKGAHVAIVDETVAAVEGFEILSPGSVVINNYEFLLVSPGWREDHPLITRARTAGLALLNEIDFAWSLKDPSQRWVALTGTNGKTSTVELTAQMLRTGGLKAIACGNVGSTVIESVESEEIYDYLVLELSSFQLHWMEDPSFVAVAILNIAEDHVDWHGSFDSYAKAKVSILDKYFILSGLNLN